jgi:hypothetical protein
MAEYVVRKYKRTRCNNIMVVPTEITLVYGLEMDLQEVGRGCGDWMERAQDRDRWQALVSTVMNFRVP